MSWPKFQKKSLVVSALQYDGVNSHEIFAFIGNGAYPARTKREDRALVIATAQGTALVTVGDWVVIEAGEYLVLNREYFAETYRALEEVAA